MSKLGIVLIVVILAIGGVGVYFLMSSDGGGTETTPSETAEFEVSNLSLSSSEISPGETVTVSINVKNTGGKEGSKEVKLTVGGNTKTESVTLASGEKTTVTFSMVWNEAGTYEVSLSGISKTLTVLKPAEFEVRDLTVNPSKIESGENVEISASVKNTGEIEGTYEAVLKIDGKKVDNKNITISQGKSTTVSFSGTIKNVEPGTYEISIGKDVVNLEVLEPAKFEVSNLRINPSYVGSGEIIEISVDVKNKGDLSGDYKAELKIYGKLEKTRKTNLDSGEETTLSFTTSKENSGSYTVEIGGLSETFKVLAVPEDSTLAGNITEDTILTKSLSPYTVKEVLQVLEDVTLKIEPGVVIRFEKDTGLNVGGELIARGTEDEKITFTSNQANPSPGNWKGIKFVDSARDAEFDSKGKYNNGSIVSFSILEYGGKSPVGSLHGSVLKCKKANPFISNNIIANNSGTDGGGIYVRNSKGIRMSNNDIENNEAGEGGGLYLFDLRNAEIRNNLIKNNNAGEGGGIYIAYSGVNIVGNKIISNTASQGGGIYSRSLYDDYEVSINKNNFERNTDYTVYRESDYDEDVEIDATNNYWGTADKSKIKNMIYDYYDDISLGKVIFEPIATEPF